MVEGELEGQTSPAVLALSGWGYAERRHYGSRKFAWGLLDKVAWVQGGLITFNTNLSQILARSYTSRVVISAQPDTEGGIETPIQSQSR